MSSKSVLIRGLDPQDIEDLERAAAARGVSLTGFARSVLHDRAALERRRRLFAAIEEQDVDLPEVDAVAEVRAVRDERERRAR